MELTVAAQNLFIAESTALSIIGELTEQGMFSSGIHNRHKVRAADVTSFLEQVALAPKNTYERVVGVAYLICYSSAAYGEIDEMITSADLKKVKVTHHFGGESRNLGDACVAEPMNLWPGWALENTRGNGNHLDLHYIRTFVANGRNVAVGNLSNGNAPKERTFGERVGAAIAANEQRIEGNFNFRTPATPKFERKLTPLSAQLKKDFPSRDVPFDAINCTSSTHPGTSRDQSHIFDVLTETRRMVLRLSKAGSLHYTILIDQLKIRPQRPTITDGLLLVLNNAQKGWLDNRNKLLAILDGLIDYVGASSKNPGDHNYYLNLPAF
jgi:hypothetical protein